MKQKRVAAIHDISCFGRCSLTVALPVISAAGIEVSVIPTAVLSTHTGGITGFTYRDLTEDILPVVRHWQSLNLTFDALYTGFLGSFEQLDIVMEVFAALKTPDNLILVDPVMADNGKLYSIFTPDFPEGMKKLCAAADIIVPNMTEAALLVGDAYREGPYDKAYIEGLLMRLADIGPQRLVLTGVYFDNAELGTAVYDRGEITYLMSRRIEGCYHGTGDVFGSALLAGLMEGLTLDGAAGAAIELTVESIERTRQAGTDVRFGVNFEAGLADFAEQLRLRKNA
jgi:pyridoxine kinase